MIRALLVAAALVACGDDGNGLTSLQGDYPCEGATCTSFQLCVISQPLPGSVGIGRLCVAPQLGCPISDCTGAECPGCVDSLCPSCLGPSCVKAHVTGVQDRTVTCAVE